MRRSCLPKNEADKLSPLQAAADISSLQICWLSYVADDKQQEIAVQNKYRLKQCQNSTQRVLTSWLFHSKMFCAIFIVITTQKRNQKFLVICFWQINHYQISKLTNIILASNFLCRSSCNPLHGEQCSPWDPWLGSKVTSVMQRFHTHSHPDLLHDPSVPPLSVIPTVFTVRLRGTGVNGCIYMVMTPVSLAVQSALTYVFVGSGTVCFEIRGSVYQRRPRNFGSRERRVQRKPATELISIQTSKSTWAIQLCRLKPNIYPVVTYV